MTRAPAPLCHALRRWLRLNLGPRCLAPLTGTDSRALDAAAHIIAQYANSGDRRAVLAFGHVVMCMQPSTRYLAYHAIAHVMDWPDRARVWALAGLPPLGPMPCCAGEA